MVKKSKSEKGLLSLEASISLTVFIFLMLFLYSFFVVFETRNILAHTLLATSESLSLDPHGAETMSESGDISQIIYGIYNVVSNSNENSFINPEKWAENTDPGNEEQKAQLIECVKQRFVAYLSGGDEGEANKLLTERYHVTGGLSGIDFSNTKIVDGKLYISIQYTLEYEYQVFGKGSIRLEQSCCSQLWK